MNHIDNREDKHVDVQKWEGNQEHVKIAIIPSSNAISNLKFFFKFLNTFLNFLSFSFQFWNIFDPTYPGAVMVEALHTVITDRTVRASRWAVNFTRVTVFLSDCHSGYLNLLFTWWCTVTFITSRGAFFVHCLFWRNKKSDRSYKTFCDNKFWFCSRERW